MEEGTWERGVVMMDFAVGSELWQAENIKERLEKLQRLEEGK